MRYALALLTHGDAAPLGRTVESFRANVTPDPETTVLCYDGKTLYGAGSPTIPPLIGDANVFVTTGRPSGFCKATRKLWETVSALADVDYVFWLEHDFEFLKPVDLTRLASVLDRQPQLVQMSLMRDAVNEQEKQAGGLFELRRSEYEKVSAMLWPLPDDPGWWLLHQIYFTTTPSLLRHDFMALNPFPNYGAYCEGRFGIDLKARGYSFGVWGEGEPWVAHRGERTGFGY